MQAAAQSRWQGFASNLPPDTYHFLEVKWRLPPGWDGHSLPRPRSTEEIADVLGANVEAVRKTDWGFVDVVRDIRRHKRLFMGFLTVPGDGAQEWWDQSYAWLLNPDGSRRPQDQMKPQDRVPDAKADERHEIEDIHELQQHVLEVHRLEYVRNDPHTLPADHQMAHDDEANDREWDQRFRPHAGG